MKRTTFYLLSFVITVFAFTSCLPMEDVFDESLLIGKWVSGTEYYRYDTGGNGATWDTSDDVSEAEGQKFTWTLVNSDLTVIHILATTGNGVPKTYTVTELTATTLKYKDSFNKSFEFTKVTKN